MPAIHSFPNGDAFVDQIEQQIQTIAKLQNL
jgi:hypothetical protein